MHFNKRNLQKNTINDIIKEDKMSALTISPEEVKRVKGLGFLNNKGTDNFSARVLTVNGKITAAQHRCLADAAELFGNGIITFTTRLSVEVQGIPFDKIVLSEKDTRHLRLKDTEWLFDYSVDYYK